MVFEEDSNGGYAVMRKQEHISLMQYFYNMQIRLENAVKDCSYRYIRRDLDSIDLLEEIIAKERLNAFKDFTQDVLTILKLNEEQGIDKR